MGTRARCFFARFNRLKLSAPLVEASSGHPEILGQFVDALAGPHALYGHALELPGISFSSLHRLSSPGECAHHECANSRGHSNRLGTILAHIGLFDHACEMKEAQILLGEAVQLLPEEQLIVSLQGVL